MSQKNADPMLKVPVTKPSERHTLASRGFQGIPGIEIAPNGRLWACWYTGGVNEGPENFVVVATSGDDGKTWTDAIAVIDPPGNVRAYDPTLWVDPLGRLWVFWAQCYSREDGNIFDGSAGTWGSFTETPGKADISWSEPLRLADGVMMNKPTVLKNGEWTFPCAIWMDGLAGGTIPEQLKPFSGANIVVSKDQGNTFEYRGGVSIPDRWFDEHMHIELNDGKLWCLVRTKYGIGRSVSDDGGVTWSDGEDTGWGGPNSRFFIRRLQSGNLLLVNHGTSESRRELTAYVSKDDGKTWRGGLMLDEREAVSYPDGTQSADGSIYIVYDWQRYKSGDILFAKFTEEDALAGKDVSGKVSLKNIISRTGGVKDDSKRDAGNVMG